MGWYYLYAHLQSPPSLKFRRAQEVPMKVLLVGNMVASCQAFERLIPELQKADAEVVSFLANGKSYQNSLEEMKSAVDSSSIVLVGMASDDLAKEEVAVAEVAAEKNIPFGFYADTYNSINRPRFAALREKASFVFVINEEEGAKAKTLYQNARVVVSGNPMWEDFFTPKLSREEVRQKLEVGDEQQMVLCPGGKNLAVNMLHWKGVIEALALEPRDERNYWKVFLSVHPGDQNGADAYKSLVNYREGVSVRVVTKDLLSASHMLPGVDLVIESASTIGIEAACQRKPVIDYFSEIALARLEETSGSRKWEPCELGVARRVDGRPSVLLSTINDLFFGGAREMRRRQEEVYPEPQQRGSAVRAMATTLQEISVR